ncbi:MAG: hypothetical protein ABWW69_07380 [Pyrodictiaceae archaeon]
MPRRMPPPLIIAIIMIILCAMLSSYSSPAMSVKISEDANARDSVRVFFYILGESTCPYCSALKEFFAKYFEKNYCFCDIRVNKNCTKALFLVIKILGTPPAVPQTIVLVNGSVVAVVIGLVEDKNFWISIAEKSEPGKVIVFNGMSIARKLHIKENELRLIRDALASASQKCSLSPYIRPLPCNVTRENICTPSNETNAWIPIVSAPKTTTTSTRTSTTSRGAPSALNLVLVMVSLALTDSINPCVITLFATLLISIATYNVATRRLATVSTAFIMGILAGYASLGILLSTGLSMVPLPHWLSSLILVGYGTILLAKTLKEGGTCLACRVEARTRPRGLLSLDKLYSLEGSWPHYLLLGLILSYTLLPCSAGPYLVYNVYIAGQPIVERILLILAYNVIFVSPLIATALAVILGLERRTLLAKMLNNIHLVRMTAALILIIIGVLYLVPRA